MIHVRQDGGVLRNGINVMWSHGPEVMLFLETATRYWSAGLRWSTRSHRFYPRYPKTTYKADIPQWMRQYMSAREARR